MGEFAHGADTAREVPEGRWSLRPEEVLDARGPMPDKVYTTRACFIEGFALDAAGLDLPPDLLGRLDPMFHLLLHAGRQAWRDARTDAVDRQRVGVIIGNIALPTESVSAFAEEVLLPAFEAKLFAEQGGARPAGSSDKLRTEPLNRYVAGLPAGVLARALGLGGGAFTLDAACASSLYAVKLACDELLAGRADAMLTGGLSRPDSLYTRRWVFAVARVVADGAVLAVRCAGQRVGGGRRLGDAGVETARGRGGGGGSHLRGDPRHRVVE